MNHSRNLFFRVAENKTGIAIVLLSSILIAMAPNAARIAYQEGANPVAVILVRYLVGAILIATYLAARFQWPERGGSAFRGSMFAGLAQVLMSFGLLGAVAYIDVSLAALIFYLHPFLIAFSGRFRGDIRITMTQFVCIVAASLGIGLVFSVNFDSINPVGISLSVLGMVAVTAYILLGAAITRSAGPLPANLYMTTWSILFLLLMAFTGSQSGLIDPMEFPASLTGWIAMLGAGVTTTAGFVLFFIGAVMIGATRASLLTLSEPLFAILIAILLVNEWLTLLQWLGVIFIIASLVRFETAH